MNVQAAKISRIPTAAVTGLIVDAMIKAGVPAADFLLCATAPLSPQLAAEAEARFRAPLHEIYGCTEAGQIATRRPIATLECTTSRGPPWRAPRSSNFRSAVAPAGFPPHGAGRSVTPMR